MAPFPPALSTRSSGRPARGLHKLRYGVSSHSGGMMLTLPELNRRTTWTEERLQRWLKAFFTDERIVVLANREPFIHDRTDDGQLVVRRSSSGLVTALEPIVRACSGVWVAHGSGNADRLVVDRRNGINVPPAAPQYRLRRVWLDDSEQRGYYYGFANEALWPLCHRTFVQPVFRSDDFNIYSTVNARFADA